MCILFNIKPRKKKKLNITIPFDTIKLFIAIYYSVSPIKHKTSDTSIRKRFDTDYF